MLKLGLLCFLLVAAVVATEETISPDANDDANDVANDDVSDDVSDVETNDPSVVVHPTRSYFTKTYYVTRPYYVTHVDPTTPPVKVRYLYLGSRRYRTKVKGKNLYLVSGSGRLYRIYNSGSTKYVKLGSHHIYRVTESKPKTKRWMLQLKKQLKSKYLYIGGKRHKTRFIAAKGRFSRWPSYKRQILKFNGKYVLIRTRVIRIGRSSRLIRYVKIGKKAKMVRLLPRKPVKQHYHIRHTIGMRRRTKMVRIRGKKYRAIYVTSRKAWYVKYRGRFMKLVSKKKKKSG